MAHVRSCDQCGAMFAPRREHARFCSARCRVAWNREHARPQATEATALDWSVSTMRDVTGRLLPVRAADQVRVVAAVSEAVWWVTIVNATLLRYHAGAYDSILAGQSPAQRRLIEGTLAGLRFVRNQMGLHLAPADFIRPAAGRPGPDEDRSPAWIWTSLPEPPLRSLPPSGQAWEQRGTARTRLGSPVIRSGRPSAGPRSSSRAPPPARTSGTSSSAPPRADSTASSRNGRRGSFDTRIGARASVRGELPVGWRRRGIVVASGSLQPTPLAFPHG